MRSIAWGYEAKPIKAKDATEAWSVTTKTHATKARRIAAKEIATESRRLRAKAKPAKERVGKA